MSGVTRVELVRVLREAQQAQADNPGLRVTDCPYKITDDDPAERLRAQAWVRGFVLSKPSAATLT